MFEYIKGKLVSKKVNYAALDVNGVAYRVNISLNTYEKLKDEIVKLYIHTYVREDIFVLYGFYDEEERKFFEILVNANGVGPKLALAVLSTYNTRDLKTIVKTEDTSRLSKVPGLGPKKTQKLMLDIKDKIGVNFELENIKIAEEGSIEEDMVLVLKSLGYGDKEVRKLISKEDISKYATLEDATKGLLQKLYAK